MPRIRHHVCAALILALLMAGQAGLLQVAAWTGMLVQRTGERGLAAAAQSTFDGRAPCPLCAMAAALRDAPMDDAAPPAPALQKKPEQPPSPLATPMIDDGVTFLPAATPARTQPAGCRPAPEPPPPRATRCA